MMHPQKGLRFILILVYLTLPLNALGEDRIILFEKVWSLKKIQGIEIPEGSSLVFEPYKVTGSTGCNKFWAPIEYKSKSQIDIGPPQSARLYCFRAMALERAFLAALESVCSYRIQGTQLKMMMEDGDIFLEFEISSNTR